MTVHEKLEQFTQDETSTTIFGEAHIIHVADGQLHIFENGEAFQHWCNGGINIWMNAAHDIELPTKE